MTPYEMDTLRTLPFLSDLSQSTIEQILKPSLIQLLPANTTLVEQDSLIDTLFITLSCDIEVTSSDGISEAVIAIVPPGRPFLLATVVMDEPSIATAKTMSPSKVIMIPASSFREALKKDARLAEKTARLIAQNYLGMAREMNNQKLRTGTQRLGSWIITKYIQLDRPTEIPLGISKRSLASFLGLTPESLSRAIGQLSSHGVLFEGSTVSVTDIKALQRVVEPANAIEGRTVVNSVGGAA